MPKFLFLMCICGIFATVTVLRGTRWVSVSGSEKSWESDNMKILTPKLVLESACGRGFAEGDRSSRGGGLGACPPGGFGGMPPPPPGNFYFKRRL